MPEEEGVRKQDGANCNRADGGSQEDVIGKEDGAVRKSSIRWPQECQPCGLLEDNGVTPPVS